MNMAKLYAEIDSDKHGRKASKGGETFLRVDIFRRNVKIGTCGIYEVPASIEKTKTPAGYRVMWHAEGVAYPESTVTLKDTTEADSTAQ